MLRVVKIPVSIYNLELVVLVGQQDEAQKWCVRNNFPGTDIEDCEYMYDALTVYNGSTFVIWAEMFDWTIGSQVTMAHELEHACVKMLGIIGIPILPDNHEALAYLYGYLFGELWNKLKPKVKKKCKKK